MRRPLALIPVGLIAAVIGCGSFGSAEENAPTPTPGDDAGTEASPIDEGGAFTDSQLDGDAGKDQGDGGCPRVVDEHFMASGLPMGWTMSSSGGTVVATPNEGFQDTPGLHANVTSNGAASAAQLQKLLASVPTSITLTYAMRVVTVASQYAEVGCTLQLQGSASNTYVAMHPFVLSGELWASSESKQAGTEFFDAEIDGKVGTLQSSNWYAVTITASAITKTSAFFTAAINGNQIVSQQLTLPGETKEVRVKCGVDYSDPGGAIEVFVDDVVLDACP